MTGGAGFELILVDRSDLLIPPPRHTPVQDARRRIGEVVQVLRENRGGIFMVCADGACTVWDETHARATDSCGICYEDGPSGARINCCCQAICAACWVGLLRTGCRGCPFCRTSSTRTEGLPPGLQVVSTTAVSDAMLGRIVDGDDDASDASDDDPSNNYEGEPSASEVDDIGLEGLWVENPVLGFSLD